MAYLRSKNKDFEKYIIWGILAFVAFQIIRVFKTGTKALGTLVNDTIVKDATSLPPAQLTLCKQVASECYDAIWNYTWGEDEDAFIGALNRLTTATQAKATSMYYAQYPKGRTIVADMLAYLSSSEQKQIKSLIKSNLQ